MGTFKKTYKLLSVVAEKQDQIFEVKKITLPTPARKIVDVTKRVIFDRVTIFRNAAIVQGYIHKQIQYVDEDFYKKDYQVNIPFHKKVELPGLTPTITVGIANRATISNNVVMIGPDGEGSNAGINVQLYVKDIQNIEELQFYPICEGNYEINCVADLLTEDLLEKVDINFLIKISKSEQVDLTITPRQVFECRYNLPCINRDC